MTLFRSAYAMKDHSRKVFLHEAETRRQAKAHAMTTIRKQLNAAHISTHPATESQCAEWEKRAVKDYLTAGGEQNEF